MKINKLLAVSLIAVFVLFAGIVFVADMSDNSSAASGDKTLSDYHLTVGQSIDISCKSVFTDVTFGSIPVNQNYNPDSGSLPPGVSITATNSGTNYSNPRFTGTPTVSGTYNVGYKFVNNSSWCMEYVNFVVDPAIFTVTYHGVLGTVNGQSTWTEKIIQNSYASLPSAQYSSGAYSFVGWCTTSTGSATISSLKVTSNIDLYAVFNQNSTTISGCSSTTSVGQIFSNSFTVTPANATISITNNGGLSGLSVSGLTVSGTINANPGTYYVVVSCTASGYKVATTTVTITVPMVIVPPADYSVYVGYNFYYKPDTNPANANVSITSTTKDGASITNSGIGVVGGALTGSFSSSGTYKITFACSASGYVGVSKTITIVVTNPPASSDPPSIGSLVVTERPDEVRMYDVVPFGVNNAVNTKYYVNGQLFAASASTALFNVPSAGVYTFRCDVIGVDGTIASASATIVCSDTYYQDMAWVGVGYDFVKIVSGSDPAVTVSGPFSYEFSTVGSQRVLSVTGTPMSSDVGKSYSISIGTSTYSISVYAAQNFAPVPEFSFSVAGDGFTVNTVFTGQYASKVLWNYGDGIWISDTSHKFKDVGYYTISCNAINNIGERQSSQLASIGIIPQSYLSLDDLTDYTGFVGETAVIKIAIVSTDTLSISGTASSFLHVSGDTITGVPTDPGEYSLTITITHGDKSVSEGTIKVIISWKEVIVKPPINWTVIAVLIVVLFFLSVVFRSATKGGHGGRNRR